MYPRHGVRLRHLPITAAFSPRVAGLRVSDWSAQLRARIRSRFLVPADTNGACILLRQAAATTATMVGQQRRMATSPALPAQLSSLFLSFFLLLLLVRSRRRRRAKNGATPAECRKRSRRRSARPTISKRMFALPRFSRGASRSPRNGSPRLSGDKSHYRGIAMILRETTTGV